MAIFCLHCHVVVFLPLMSGKWGRNRTENSPGLKIALKMWGNYMDFSVDFKIKDGVVIMNKLYFNENMQCVNFIRLLYSYMYFFLPIKLVLLMTSVNPENWQMALF